MKIDPVNLHRLAEARSLAYHRAVGERIVREPALLEAVRQRLLDFLAAGRSPHHARAWLELVEGPRERLLALLVDEGAAATELRQSTPFAGLLPPRERWALWRTVREQLERAS